MYHRFRYFYRATIYTTCWPQVIKVSLVPFHKKVFKLDINVGYGSLGSMDFSECGLLMLRLSSRVSLGIIKDIISSTLKVN
jgi:hypothetical protein